MSWKTISGTCEITTGAYSPVTSAPVYQLETGATLLSVDLLSSGSPYTIQATESGSVKFYFASSGTETEAISMSKSGNNLSCDLTTVLTAIAGQATAVIKLTDSGGDISYLSCSCAN